jgi:hypothetical protein
MLSTIKYRPIVIAERHNSSFASYLFYLYLKNNPNIKFDYCLFEGGETTQSHIEHIENAFITYKECIASFLKTTEYQKIYAYIQHDLYHQDAQFSNYVTKNIVLDLKKFPYEFGHIRNLSVHYLLYNYLKKNHTQWIPIDNKRKEIKKAAHQKIANQTAYLYQKHHLIGNITTEEQKTLLEASVIRSKYMSDEIFNHSVDKKCFCLIGSQHAYDLAYYTPDLSDIFGYSPEGDNYNFYHYNTKNSYITFNLISDFNEISSYLRAVTFFNSQKIKSSFGLKNDYLLIIDKIKNS